MGDVEIVCDVEMIDVAPCGDLHQPTMNSKFGASIDGLGYGSATTALQLFALQYAEDVALCTIA